MGFCKNRRKKLGLTFLGIAILIAVICSGCDEKEKDTPQIGAPFAINSSGDLLFCVIKRGGVYQPYIIPLKNNRSQPIALKFSGSESCLGATWRSGAEEGRDELLFVTGGTPQTIKRFRIVDSGLSEISSYIMDPNLSVVLLNQRFSNRDILAFRVEKWGDGRGVYLGFSKDNGQTISFSEIAPPAYILWIDRCIFYMAHDMEDGRMVMSKAQLDVDSMTLQTSEILQEDEIIVATKSLNGSPVYVTGHSLFRGNEILTLLPEGMKRPYVDGSYLACVSEDGKKIYILSDKGEILDIKQKDRESMFVGLCAANECIYLTTKGREKIIGYDFIEKIENVVFDPNNAP